MKTSYQYEQEMIRATTPCLSYRGGDVAAWQKTAREKLSSLLHIERMRPAPADLDIEFTKKQEGFTEIRFTFQSEPGYRVPCHLLLPDGIKNPPLMICLQGHSTGMHISLGRPKFERDVPTIQNGDRDFCVRALKEGWAAIALEMRSFGECGGDPETGAPGCWDPTMTALLLGRTAIGERVWDISRLIDVLEKDFADKVDLSCIGVMGNSGGGTCTSYVMALEPRVALAMPSCAMSNYNMSIGVIHHCQCNFVPEIALYFDMSDLIAMAAPKYYVQVSGESDKIFPIEGAKDVFEKGKKAYEALGCPDRCAFVHGALGHRFYADDAWPVVHRLTKR